MISNGIYQFFQLWFQNPFFTLSFFIMSLKSHNIFLKISTFNSSKARYNLFSLHFLKHIDVVNSTKTTYWCHQLHQKFVDANQCVKSTTNMNSSLLLYKLVYATSSIAHSSLFPIQGAVAKPPPRNCRARLIRKVSSSPFYKDPPPIS